MTLRITRSADPITVERLNVCIYAQPGIGKTSLGFTADAPLLLDFDQGAHRCMRLATDFYEFASRYLPDLHPMLEAA